MSSGSPSIGGGSPRPKWAARMNSAMRKSSTILSFTRSTPSRAPSVHSSTHERESSDSASSNKQKVDTTQAITSPDLAESVPSPINESPVREAAAAESNVPVGPSPLVQEVRSTSPDQIDSPSPVGYIPPPVIESAVGNPGAFIDHADEELPQPVTVVDPYTPQRVESTHDATSVRDHSIRAPSAHADSIPNELTETVAEESKPGGEPKSTEEAKSAEEYHDVPGVPVKLGAVAPAQTEYIVPPDQDSRSSHRNPSSRHVPESSQANQPADEPSRFPPPSMNRSMPDNNESSYFDPTFVKPSHSAEGTPEFAIAVQEVPLGNSISRKPRELKDSIPVDSHLDSMPVPTMYERPGQPTVHEQPLNAMPVPVHDASFAPSNGSPMHIMPVYGVHSGTEVWGDIQPNEGNQSNAAGFSNKDDVSNRASTPDPFSDPIAPRINVTHSNESSLPNPHIPEPRLEDGRHGMYQTIQPQPSLYDGVADRSLRREASVDAFEQRTTDETQPLLSHSATPKGAPYLQPNTAHNTYVRVSPITSNTSAWNPHSTSAAPKLHELGWIEYHLPDSTFYYVHPTRRVITDINLRIEKTLNVVTAYLEGMKEDIPAGCELWLRDAGTPRKGLSLVRSLVNHNTRSVTVEVREGSKRNKKAVEDDPLDTEFRYWSFMEGHPEHTNLPPNAKTDAFEALSWAWTDRLLPSNGDIPAPFTQEECRDLSNFLRSFTTDDGIQTRLVARILLRVARWRQMFFRPGKPLPKDVAAHVSPVFGRRRSFARAVLELLISAICLGIPYIFFERHHQHRIDEESGLRNAGPMMIIGACTCLVAAIVLSASVTFLSLPGLDNVGRIAGLVATLFSSFSMASTLVAIFKYKADLVRTVPSLGEGLTWVSKRSIIFSLPLVFLAYAIIGFVTGIILYALRGGTLTNPNILQSHFDPYIRWTTVGAMGAFAGVLTTTFLLRR